MRFKAVSSEFQTPKWCCEYMVGLLNSDTINTVLEPTPGLGILKKTLEDAKYNVCAPLGDFFEMDLINKKFDAIVMNPPFSPPKLGYEILFKCLELSDVIICLQPWHVIINSESRTMKLQEFGLKSVTHLPRRTFPGSRVQCCVLELRKGWNQPTELRFLNPPKKESK